MIRDGTGCKNAGGHSHAINPHVEWVPSPFCLNFCFSSSNSSKQPYPITTTESKCSMIKRGRMSSMIVHTVSNFSLISFLSVLLSLEVQAAPKQLSRIVSKLNSMISNHDQHNIFFSFSHVTIMSLETFLSVHSFAFLGNYLLDFYQGTLCIFRLRTFALIVSAQPYCARNSQYCTPAKAYLSHSL